MIIKDIFLFRCVVLICLTATVFRIIKKVLQVLKLAKLVCYLTGTLDSDIHGQTDFMVA